MPAKRPSLKPKKTLAETIYGDARANTRCPHPRWWRLHLSGAAICLHEACCPEWPPKFVDIKTGRPVIDAHRGAQPPKVIGTVAP